MHTRLTRDPNGERWVRLPLKAAALSAREIAPLLTGCTLEEVERELILCTLASLKGNRTDAADVLGISVRTLRNRIRDYGSQGAFIPPPISGRD